MTFDEQAVELARLEARAISLGIPDVAFNRIAIEVMQDARRSSVPWTPEQVFDEIRRLIEPPRTKGPGAP